MRGLVDWHLLVLFGGPFLVTHALGDSGLPDAAMRALADAGVLSLAAALVWLHLMGYVGWQAEP